MPAKSSAKKSAAKKSTSLYVDGFVIPVPRSKLARYKAMARLGSEVWRDHGALSYHECVADDVPVGKWTSFPRAVKLKEDEVVIFAWITYASRKDRDRINKAVMADKRMHEFMKPGEVVFDGKRLIFGGFMEMVGW